MKKPLIGPKLSLTFFVSGLLMISFSIFLIFSMGRIHVIEAFLTLMPQKKLTGINILAMGIDSTQGVQHSDTIMVLHLDDINNRIGILSIPRDTRVYVPKVGVTKINHAYAYGGVELLQKAVAQFLNVPIEYYIKVNLPEVEAMIDKLGGVNVDVDKNMYYQDKAGDLHIDLKKGDHKNLNGKEAVAFLRFRKDAEGDIGRIQRQQTFVQQLGNKILNPKFVPKLPAVLEELSSKMETNLSSREILGLANAFNHAFQDGHIEKTTIPGTASMIGGVSYWRPDLIATDELVDKVLLGYKTERAQVASKIKTSDKQASQDNRRQVTLSEMNRVAEQTKLELPGKDQRKTILIEVLNGSGHIGFARKVARDLKVKGFKVPRYGNAANFGYKNTMIVAWRGDIQNVLGLANLLKIDASHIIVYDKPTKKLDATIVIGQDWGTTTGL